MERLSRIAVGEVSISAVTPSELMYGVAADGAGPGGAD